MADCALTQIRLADGEVGADLGNVGVALVILYSGAPEERGETRRRRMRR
jgi:hypothetical protein